MSDGGNRMVGLIYKIQDDNYPILLFLSCTQSSAGSCQDRKSYIVEPETYVHMTFNYKALRLFLNKYEAQEEHCFLSKSLS